MFTSSAASTQAACPDNGKNQQSNLIVSQLAFVYLLNDTLSC